MAQKEIIGSGGCFPQYAQVLTTSGYKKISEIVVGDKVVSYNDTGRLSTSTVETVFFHKDNKVSKYNYWGGVIYATANHWVLNQLNSFSEIGKLSTHDCLVDVDNTLRPMISSEEFSVEDVYNLSVTPDHTYIVEGIRVHNGGGGKGGGGSRPAVEDPNTLRSRQYARVLDLISEGEIEGLVSGHQSVFINDVPLQNADRTYNFKNSYIELRTGTQDQAVISDLNAVENTTNVSSRIERTKLIQTTYTATAANSTTLTLTLANHGYKQGETVYLTPVNGNLPEGAYVISSALQDTYVITVPSGTYTAGKVYVSGDLFNNIRTGSHAVSTKGITKTITRDSHGFQEGESVYIWSAPGGAFPLSVYQVTRVINASTFTVVLDTPLAIAASTVFIQRAVGTPQTVSNTEADEVYITMEVPQLTFQDTTTGDLHGSSVSFVVNVKDSSQDAKYVRAALMYNVRDSGVLSGTKFIVRDTGIYESTSGSNSVLYASPPPKNNTGTTLSDFIESNARTISEITGFQIYSETEESSESQLVVAWRTDNNNRSATDTLKGINKEQNCSINIYKRLVGSTSENDWVVHTTISFSGKNETRQVSNGFFGTNTVYVPVYTTQVVTVDHPLGIYQYKCQRDGTGQGIFGFTNASRSVTYDSVGVISGKTLSKYQRGYTIPLKGQGPWQLQVLRVEEESTKANVSNELYWSTFTEIVKARLKYPNSAMVYCAIDAEQFSSIPSRSYEIYGIKCKYPNNYNPLTREYTDFWDGEFSYGWTDNPAWVFYDLITNTRYGLGDIVNETLVDKWTLYSIGKYCDGSVPTGLGVSGVVVGSISANTLTVTDAKSLSTIGLGSIVTGFDIEECSITALQSGTGRTGTYTISKSQSVPQGSSINIIIDDVEPRFTCNLYLQTREDAYKVVSNLASIFRGMVFWSTGLVTASQDSPKLVDAVYTAANVIDGTFTYTGTSAKTRHNVVLVSWNNPKNGYALEVEYVQDEASIIQNGIIQTEVSAMGCTSQGQAHRLGKWILYTEQYETETVTFKTGLDGLLSQPGDVIQTQDPFRSGIRLGGRVSSVTYNAGVSIEVTIDNGITFRSDPQKTLTYTAIFTKDDGTIISLRLSNTLNNQKQNVLKANTTESFTIPVGSVWVVAVSDLALQSWRVVSVAEPSKGVMSITALSYNEEKFNNIEYNHRLQPKKITTQSLIPEPVENINITEHMYTIAPQVLSNILSISWESPDTSIDTYQVSYRNITTNDNEVTLLTNLPSIEISPISEADYVISVQAINALGTKSQKTIYRREVKDPLGIAPSTYIDHYTVVGKTVNPADITNFSTILRDDSIVLTWSALADLDIDYYEVRYGSWGSDSAANAAVYRGKSNQATLPTKNTYVSGKDHLFYVKAKDTSGNWSASYTLNNILINNISAKILENSLPKPQLVPNSAAGITMKIALPNPPTNAGLVPTTGLSTGNILKITWTAAVVNTDNTDTITNNISTYGYRIYVNNVVIDEVTNTSYEYLWLDNAQTKTFKIETIDNSGQASLNNITFTKSFTAPKVVTLPTNPFSFLGNKLTLKWNAQVLDSTNAQTKLYRIYLDSTAIAEVTGTTYEFTWTDKTLSRTFLIETVDVLNNVSTRVSVPVTVSVPAVPTNIISTLEGTTLKTTWTAPVLSSNSLPIAKYNVFFGDSGNPIKLDEALASSYSLEWTYKPAPGSTSVTKAIVIEAVDINGNTSSKATTTEPFTVVATNAPSNLQAVMKENNLLFSWNPATLATNSLPIQYYELREGGTSWIDSRFIANIPAFDTALQYLYAITNVNNLAALTTVGIGTLQYDHPKVFRIASRDVLGTNSVTQFNQPITLTKPSAVSNLDTKIAAQYINATWNPIILGVSPNLYTLPINRYEIRESRSSATDDTTWNAAKPLASLSGTAIALDPPTNDTIYPAENKDGIWYHLIRAYDSFGTAGFIATRQLTISKPTKPINLFNKVIDNNILLNWEDPATHSFPIATYMLKKSLNAQATYIEAEIIGTKSGNFTSVFEESSGNYNYFLAAIDTAGNISDMSQTNATVNQPPDYVLNGDIYRDNFDVTSYGSNTVSTTRGNIVKSSALGTPGVSKLIGPMSSSQTFETHFTGNSWTLIQDQPNAGYPIYAQPAVTTGFTRFNVTSITSGTTFTSGVAHGLAIGNKISPLISANGLVQFTTYYVQSVPTTTSFTLSETDSGSAITSFTSGSGLSIRMSPPEGSGTLTEVIDYGIVFTTNQYVSIATDITNISGTTGTYQITLSTGIVGSIYNSLPATSNQTLFSNITAYVVGSNNIAVYRNGIRLNSNQYAETSTTSITLASGAAAGDTITVIGINYTSVSSAVQPAANINSTFGTTALNFRYVKVQIILNSNTTGIDLMRINSYRLRLSLKYTNDGGSGEVTNTGIYQINLSGGGSGYTSTPTVTIDGSGVGATARAILTGQTVSAIEVTNSGSNYTSILPANITITGGGGGGATVGSIVKTSATSGAIVAFNYDYLDVSSIQLTYGGTTPGLAIYDFVDTTYPKFFRVLIFNNSGTPITGKYSWSAKGTI